MSNYAVYFFVFLVIFAGSFVQGIAGFGSAMVWMSFLPLFIEFKEASALVPFMLTGIGLQMTLKLYKDINFKTAIVPLAVSIVGTFIGAWILNFTTTHTMQIVLGIFLILVGVYSFATSKNPIQIKATPLNGGIAGMTSGIFTGLLNIGGPPLGLYYNAAAESTMEFKANIEFNFLLMYGWAAILKFFNGEVTKGLLQYFVPGYIGVILGGILGLYFFSKFDKKKVSYIVWTMLIIMGTFQLAKAFKLF